MCLTAGTPHLRIDNCFSVLQIGAVHAANEGGLLTGLRFVRSCLDVRVTAGSGGTLCMARPRQNMGPGDRQGITPPDTDQTCR